MKKRKIQIYNPKVIAGIFFFIASVYFFLSIIGGIRGYTPVPIGDVWTDYINFFIKLSDKDMSVWWSQLNEHRVLLTRILFWLDHSWFGGTTIFLFVIRYILVGISFYCFYSFLKETIGGEQEKYPRVLIASFIFALLFSWIQEENFLWATQDQFFSAQLLPFISFYLLHKAYKTENNSNQMFLLACIIGFASIGIMANGVLNLPLMTLMAMILKMGWRKISVLLVLSIFSIFLYFYDFYFSPQHLPPSEVFFYHFFDLIKYILLYLGGPFFFMVGSDFHGDGNGPKFLFAQIFGLLFILLSIAFAYRSLKEPKKSSLKLGLLTFILYIGGSAFITGLGRVDFGIWQALSSRYTTPVIMGWLALLILYSPSISQSMKIGSYKYVLSLFLVLLFLLPSQFNTIGNYQRRTFEQKVALLAVTLGIVDRSQISNIYFDAETVITFAKRAAEKKLSIFGNPLFQDIQNTIGRVEPFPTNKKCKGNIEQISELVGDKRYLSIGGWIFQSDSKGIPIKIEILDKDGLIVGMAITTNPKPDIIPRGKIAEFKGYLLSGQIGKEITLNGKMPDCAFKTLALPTI